MRVFVLSEHYEFDSGAYGENCIGVYNSIDKAKKKMDEIFDKEYNAWIEEEKRYNKNFNPKENIISIKGYTSSEILDKNSIDNFYHIKIDDKEVE